MNFALFFGFRNLWIIAPVIFFTLWWYWETKQEEKVLSEKFGEEYVKYKRKIGMFLPKIT
jgi:protein-S-isoprenylcysteine O-methyltransferase Ste14